MSPSSLTEVLRETLALFDDSGPPLTTAEVAERLDVGRRSTYERLERLVDHDRLETKAVGANGRVWWRPTPGTAGRSAGPADGPATVEAERRLLADVSRSVATAESFADGVESALAAVATHTEWAYGEAWAPVEDGDHLEYVAGHAEDTSLAPFLNASESVTFPFGEGLPGRVYASGSPEWIPNASAASDTTFHRTDLTSDVGLRAALGVPITADGSVLAVLTFFLRDRREADDRLVNVVTDVAGELGGLIARKQAEDALAAERALLDRTFTTSPVGMLVIDADGTISRANRYATDLFGGANEELVGDAVGDVDVGFRTPDGEELPATQLPVARTLERGEPVEDVELKLVRDGGETRWVSVSTAPIRTADDAVDRVTAVVEDVTERKDRERRYDAIFNQTYQFTGLLEPDGTLVEVNEAALAFAETDRAAVVGKKFWDADWFQPGETADTVRDAVERALEGEFVRQEINVQGSERTAIIDFSIRPVTDERGEVTHLVPEGRDITDRVEAKRELERHRDHLAALNHVNAIVQDVTGAVIEQSTRAEIERTVCESLVDKDSYDAAWIGDVARDQQTVTVRTGVGVQDPLDELNRPVAPEDERRPEPTRRAYQTGTIRVRHGIDGESRRERVDAPGDRSVAAIPLVHDETVYGVLTVYAARPNAFEEHEQAVLGQLGEIVGQAITAAERKQALMSDELVELEFRIPDALESMGIDAPTDGRIVVDDVVPTSDRAHLVYGTATPDARGTLDALIDQHPHWDSMSVLSETDDWIRFQARVTALPLRSAVASDGGSITEAVIEDGNFDLRIHVPPSEGVSAITETVEGRFPTARLHAKRQFPRPRDSVTEIRRSLSEKLTTRQQAVLEAAYHRGYFEWPRDATGEDVADSLGISPPTFSEHLRMAEKTVVEAVLSSATPA